MTFPEAFAAIERGELGPAEARAAFGEILAGAWTGVQIGAFAAALRLRGETAEAIVAAATALREVMTPVEHGLPEVIDTCGTGGDGAHTLNISTAAAVVVASCGVFVAKHGNRSVSSKCGSADVIDALGIPTDVAPERQAAILREAQIAFLMAPAHHPALRHAAAARRELGFRTIFNALGPLVNPARATHQLVGVYDDALRPIAAEALGKLGVRRAWVVRSVDGLDELSPAGPTRVSILDHGRVEERTLRPEDFGIIALPARRARRWGRDRERDRDRRDPRGRATSGDGSDRPQRRRRARRDARGRAARRRRGGSRRARERPRRGDPFHLAPRGDREPREDLMILDDILAQKRTEIAGLAVAGAPVDLGLAPRGALVRERLRRTGPLRLITEIKHRSPSAGALSTALGVAERARVYGRGGAAMISVLCDERFFGGGWDDVTKARRALDEANLAVPVLAKEFVLDERQIDEAAARGADAVLLIARIVTPQRLATLRAHALARGLQPLVEVVNEKEVGATGDALVIGVNARDLDTLKMDAAGAARVLAAIGKDRIALHLSGLKTGADVAAVATSGVDGALMGEALMRLADPAPLLAELLAAAG